MRQSLVVAVVADAIRVALDRDRAARVLAEEGDELVEVVRGAGVQFGPAAREQDVAQGQHQSSLRDFRLQRVDLPLQFSSLRLRLRGLRFRLCGRDASGIGFERAGLQASFLALGAEGRALILQPAGFRLRPGDLDLAIGEVDPVRPG